MNLIDILNQYLELYNRALNFRTCIVILNMNQYNGEGTPINLNEITNLNQDLINLYHNIGKWLTDALIGDEPAKEVVENRIKIIGIKLEFLEDSKLFEEWDENNNRVSIIDTNILMKYYNQDDLSTIKTSLENIDACIRLANIFIKQSIEQVARDYLSIDTEPEDSTEGLRLPVELDTTEARKYFKRAMERGYINTTSTGLEWVAIGGRGGKAQLGYFLSKIYPHPRPINALEKFFDVKKLSADLTNAELDYKRADVVRWRTDIYNLFLD